MHTPEEKPRGGGDWLGNARVSEQNRANCIQEAENAEARGDAELAERLREYAAAHLRDRDRIQREEERRATDHSSAPRRYI